MISCSRSCIGPCRQDGAVSADGSQSNARYIHGPDPDPARRTRSGAHDAFDDRYANFMINYLPGHRALVRHPGSRPVGTCGGNSGSNCALLPNSSAWTCSRATEKTAGL